MDPERLIPANGRPDLRGMYRHALAEHAIARRERDNRRVRRLHSLIVKCLRALRYAAKMRAGRARGYPRSPYSSYFSYPLFSDEPEKVRETTAPVATPDSDRRRTLREGRRRR